jgi:GntR family transcriptional regulator
LNEPAKPVDAAVLERSGMPLYMQVAGLLRKRLEAGFWRMGDQLPIIDALMAEYGVSRVTMRQALAELERDSLVKRGRGRGTFVTRDLTKERWLIVPTEWSALITHVDSLNSRFVQLESSAQQPPAPICAGGISARYWHMRRVNYTGGGTPYSLTNLYLEQGIFERNAKAYASRPILPLLAQHLGRSLGKATQRLTVSTADIETARHLQISVGMPVVDVLRRVWNRAGSMVCVVDARYSARHLSIETILHAPAGARRVRKRS